MVSLWCGKTKNNSNKKTWHSFAWWQTSVVSQIPALNVASVTTVPCKLCDFHKWPWHDHFFSTSWEKYRGKNPSPPTLALTLLSVFTPQVTWLGEMGLLWLHQGKWYHPDSGVGPTSKQRHQCLVRGRTTALFSRPGEAFKWPVIRWISSQLPHVGAQVKGAGLCAALLLGTVYSNDVSAFASISMEFIWISYVTVQQRLHLLKHVYY